MLASSLGAAATLIGASALAGVVVIGNPNLPFNHLSKGVIKQLFLEQPVSLNTSDPIQVYDQPNGSPIYAEFYKDVFDWSLIRINNYWNSNIFNGQGDPLPKLNDDREVIAVVEGTPGAISYIDSSSLPMARGNVKILLEVGVNNTYRVKHYKAVKKSITKKTTSKASPKASLKASNSKLASIIKAAKLKTAKAAKALAEVKAINASLYAKTHAKKPPAVIKKTKKKVAHAVITKNLWASIGNQFTLQSNSNRPLVRKRIEWYVAHPSQLEQGLNQAKPYLFYISKQAKLRHFPAEVTLLPLLMSDYNPNSKNIDDAAGLWQITTPMARTFGMQNNWWYDGRKNTVTATNATFNYLSTLHDTFKSWLLTFAALQAGGSTVQKAIQDNLNQHKPSDFWSLDLPIKTKTFVANLIALTQMIKYPSYYQLKVPHIIGKPYFQTVDLTTQMDLAQISKLSQVPVNTIKTLNPGILQWATNPNKNIILLLPRGAAGLFQAALRARVGQPTVSWQYHQVQAGESVKKIADVYQTTIEQLIKINNLTGILRVGQGILVPVPQNNELTSNADSAPEASVVSHKSSVKPAPSLRSIISKINAS